MPSLYCGHFCKSLLPKKKWSPPSHMAAPSNKHDGNLFVWRLHGLAVLAVWDRLGITYSKCKLFNSYFLFLCAFCLPLWHNKYIESIENVHPVIQLLAKPAESQNLSTGRVARHCAKHNLVAVQCFSCQLLVSICVKLIAVLQWEAIVVSYKLQSLDSMAELTFSHFDKWHFSESHLQILKVKCIGFVKNCLVLVKMTPT